MSNPQDEGLSSSRFAGVADSALLVAYAANFDEAAFTELHDRHAAPLQQFIRQAFRLADNEIDDVTQAVWLQVSENRIDATRVERVGSWLRAIGAGESKRLIRNRERRKADQLHEDHLAISCDSPIDELIDLEDRSRIFATLAGLEPQQRQAIELIYSHGLTIQETAQRLGVPIMTLWRKLQSVKNRVRSLSA